MGMPISIRLDDDVRGELEAQAQARGIGLATLIRDLATDAARAARRERIRRDSARVAEYVANSPDAAAFYDDWGTPRADIG
jgi:GNAT superfamily N-acetyltransferase